MVSVPAGDWSRRREGADRPPDFAALLGPDAWLRLPPEVRRRFDAAACREAHAYVGTMDVRATSFGRAIAWLCLPLGAPLAPWCGAGVPVEVRVWPRSDGGLVWDRFYDFAGRRRLLVTSRKALAKDGGLVEIARGGLGMRLAVTVEHGALTFRSTGYFLNLGPLTIPIPLLLTPGVACVTHQATSGGWFRFSMRFVHPLAGETLFQSGLFHDPEAGP